MRCCLSLTSYTQGLMIVNWAKLALPVIRDGLGCCGRAGWGGQGCAWIVRAGLGWSGRNYRLTLNKTLTFVVMPEA